MDEPAGRPAWWRRPLRAVAPGLAGRIGRQCVPLGRLCGFPVAFNLLPGLPLDGGRAVQALVWWSRGDVYRGNRIAGWAGRAVALSCVVAALGLYANRAVTLVGAVL